jgi:glycosidase
MKRSVPALVVLAAVLSARGLVAVLEAVVDPASVTIAGSVQSELGCAGDWDPACAATHLGYDAADDVWQRTFEVPAGSWEYKAALNDSWDENYGQNATPGGANIPLNLTASASVKFYYDHKTHWITDNRNSVIAVVPGSFQSELGCPGDWDPGCLRAWLQDPGGSGSYRFTAELPPGAYEAKVAINESWTENYGAGGVPNGPNIPFSVPAPFGTVTFSYNATTHVLEIDVAGGEPSPDNNVEWDGLRHDSRDPLYRAPGGAVTAGTEVKIRFRTFHNDVTGVTLRTYDVDDAAQQLVPMHVAASAVACPDAGAGRTCDLWEATLQRSAPANLWYRFIVTDGTDTDYYADNTPALDGGPGLASDDAVDNSYALMFYPEDFETPPWARSAVVYQVFPDRFRNGRANNDARTGDPRYDDPVLALPWGTKPEGYCRNYADSATNCPWRFDPAPPDWSPDRESPRGRDYFGGDLKGLDQQLAYLQQLGVTALYLNPIFDAASNHAYDTQDYLKLDPYFGTPKDWDNLTKHAGRRGMRLLLDGVFNHVSSDSPFFDRDRRFDTLGACESLGSPYRAWFYFRDVPPGTGACAGPSGPDSATYDGWFGFDSLPVLNKSLPAVQQYFLTGPPGIATYWLDAGASGWRLDVMGDASFPAGYWESFRHVVKQKKPGALIVGELWQKDTTLLRHLRGDRADTTMNYRLRDAVLGFLAPGPFDAKGFADSGRVILPSEFASRLESIREDYPPAAYDRLMNLLGSHDTERVLWTLTPGAETEVDKELNAANLTEGKLRLRLASLVQFFVPGAPTIYYGDEVGMTGDDDPDDRRTYPWEDLGGTPDTALLSHYQALVATRRANPVLVDGDFRALLADDGADTVALGRTSAHQAAVLVINRGVAPQTVDIPVAGYLPDGTVLGVVYGVEHPSGGAVVVAGSVLRVALGAMSGALLVSGTIDLAPPPPPTGLHVTSEGNGQVSVAWNPEPDAAGYHVYTSSVSGGGYVRSTSAPITETTSTVTGLPNAVTIYFVVTAVDGSGNESEPSNEASGMPHLTIGWANLQWPPSLTHTISAVNRTGSVYGQVWIDGVTNLPGATPGLLAQLGYGPDGSDPGSSAGWSWVDATFNVDAGNNDEFRTTLLPESVGTFDYVYRYSTTLGRDWLYADLNGPFGGTPPNPGSLTVTSSGDTTPPAAPGGLYVASASAASISLGWDAVLGDPTLYGYEVLRSETSGGPYALVGTTTATSFTDASVVEGLTYYYVVRSVDLSFNRSGNSGEVFATAQLRTVTLVFTVTVPATTDGTGRAVYIAGTLDRLDGGLPQWNPGGVVLTRVDATHWTITLTGREGVQIEYKFTLGSWDYVEKDGTCGEIANRQLTLSYGTTGSQTINDAVSNWRNVAPCGN